MTSKARKTPTLVLSADALSPDIASPVLSSGRSRKGRRKVTLPAAALFDDGSASSVMVLDLSYDGCKVESALALLPGMQFTLSVLGLGKMPATVRWYCNGFAGLSLGPEPVQLSPDKPRQHQRAALKAKILVRRSGRKNYYVQTVDVSPSGCKIDFVDRPLVGERHWVKFEGLDALEGEVRWVEGFSAGLKFIRPIYPAVFELLLAQLRLLELVAPQLSVWSKAGNPRYVRRLQKVSL